MRRLVLICLLFVSVLSMAQTDTRYAAYIEMPRAYVSGVCVLQTDGDTVRGCLFNEFGVTVLDFTYDSQRQKVKLHHVVKMLDRWYIRRVLRKDLAQLMIRLQRGETQYRNERRQITYQFTPIKDEATE